MLVQFENLWVNIICRESKLSHQLCVMPCILTIFWQGYQLSDLERWHLFEQMSLMEVHAIVNSPLSDLDLFVCLNSCPSLRYMQYMFSVHLSPAKQSGKIRISFQTNFWRNDLWHICWEITWKVWLDLFWKSDLLISNQRPDVIFSAKSWSDNCD